MSNHPAVAAPVRTRRSPDPPKRATVMERGDSRPCRGFTLVELLVVTSIILVLVGLVTPAMSSLLASTNLARAGQVVTDQINLARQTASTRNSMVEVRFFKLSTSSVDGYSAVQLWMNNSSGTMVALTKLAKIPAGIVVAQNTALSAAFAQAPTPLPTATAAGVANAPYVSFQVRPSGIVTPALNMNAWYMTMVPVRFANSTTIPDNYVTVQMNPLTGTPLVYRP